MSKRKKKKDDSPQEESVALATTDADELVAADAADAPDTTDTIEASTDTAGNNGHTRATDGPRAAEEITTESVVEAILMVTDTPLPANRIAQILGVGNAADVKKHIDALNDHYLQTGRSFRIEEIAKGFQLLTQPAYNAWLSKVLRVRSETKLTGAALETLAIIAYKQPVLRAQIESIRGVAAGDMVNRLREMNLVKIVGRAEELGRPMLYGTTKHFLEVFGLASLEDLPKSEELTPPPETQ